MTRRKILVAVLVVVIVVGGLTGVLLRNSAPQLKRPAAVALQARDGIPAAAQSAMQLLLSRRGREALTPELNATLPHGGERLFPVGSRFSPTARSWHQAGLFANVTGILHEPGKAAVKAEIGFVDRRGRWLVTFEGGP